MLDYYKRRAGYYERVYHKPERQSDLRAMEAWLPAAFASRRVLEVACGTGWWTAHGARDAASWLATDLNPETMEVARAKTLPGCVGFATADAYTLAEIGDQRFDAAFAGCWWSHIPLERLDAWIDTLHSKLEPRARVVVLDNRFVPTSSTPITRRDARGNTWQMRSLDDGSQHEVLKNFPERAEAFALLGTRAIDPQWIAHAHYWILSYLAT
ncbi:MAG: class I SAM-dependent methyltransferase [Burkholderiales bacterium]|nr:class I SAM-dependent methyltransferase [Burkholderiales bacterium]MDE2397779.1 class I SAM-dependent methyltransferase [Burkholderiales bacterium]MDE2452116.1 class I SAM-dependent methyltransferase [Burkholderiales bacterium]